MLTAASNQSTTEQDTWRLVSRCETSGCDSLLETWQIVSDGLQLLEEGKRVRAAMTDFGTVL